MLNPFAPLIAIAQPPFCPPGPIPRIQLKLRCLRTVTIPVTHLARKAFQMRHKTPAHLRNPLKKRSLQRHE
jgi:hypothetical protein